MATIKVFDCDGVKVIKCFDTLATTPYFVDEDEISASDDTEAEE